MSLEVTIHGGDDSPRVWTSNLTTIIVGRDPGCDLVIAGVNAEVVSGRHVRVTLDRQKFAIEDLGSANGTFLNERRLSEAVDAGPSPTVRLGRRGPILKIRSVNVDGSRAPTHRDESLSALPRRTPFREAEVTPGVSVVPLCRDAEQENVEVESDVDLPRRSSTTRLLLTRMQTRQRWLFGLGGTASIAMVIGLVFGIASLWTAIDAQQTSVKEAKHELTRRAELEKELYRNCARATAWILVENGEGDTFRGSGFLVDRRQSWIITNYHVVEDAAKIVVYFPTLTSDGNIITDLAHYRSRRPDGTATVVAAEAKRDIALIRISALPMAVQELPLARETARPGEKSFTMGHTGTVDGALWIFSAGHVKAFVPGFEGKYEGGQRTKVNIIVTDNTTEPGDSGGPVINDRGEVIGIEASSPMNARLQNHCIDVLEIRDFLARQR